MVEQGAGQNAVSTECSVGVWDPLDIDTSTHSPLCVCAWNGSDFPRLRAATQLVGKLYTLCKKSSERHHGLFDLFDKDAIAYAK